MGIGRLSLFILRSTEAVNEGNYSDQEENAVELVQKCNFNKVDKPKDKSGQDGNRPRSFRDAREKGIASYIKSALE
jgi:hypothetical protein